MSKAKELKEAFEWGKKNGVYNLDFPDVDWLLQQAEKAEKYEKIIAFIQPQVDNTIRYLNGGQMVGTIPFSNLSFAKQLHRLLQEK